MLSLCAWHMTTLQSTCFNNVLWSSSMRCSERSLRKCSISQMVVQVNTTTVRISWICAIILWTLELKLNGVFCHFTRTLRLCWGLLSLNVEYFTVGNLEAEGNCLRAALHGCGQRQGLTVSLLPSCHYSQEKWANSRQVHKPDKKPWQLKNMSSGLKRWRVKSQFSMMDGGGLEWSRPWIRKKERWLLTFSYQITWW